jgi:GT2 family glycosyltransferase
VDPKAKEMITVAAPDDGRPSTAEADNVKLSIVILTFARDETLKATLAHLRGKLGRREDIEIVLVDNNTDSLDRTELLSAFPVVQVVKTMINKGVSARNDGMAAARGAYIALLDDDVLVERGDFLDRFAAVFDAEPEVGVIMAKKLDSKTMTQLPECIPHTRKDVDVDKPFLTFRFLGGLVGVRRAMFEQVGGFSPEFFFGLEEHEYSFRIVQGGWKVMYIPDVVSVETNASGGRTSRYDAQTDLLCNRYMIAYLHMPFFSMIVNQVLFTGYLYMKERGQISVPRAVGNYVKWLGKPGRARRRPIDQRARAYIRACGGVTWR